MKTRSAMPPRGEGNETTSQAEKPPTFSLAKAALPAAALFELIAAVRSCSPYKERIERGW
jgi:uncharacterized protein YciW